MGTVSNIATPRAETPALVRHARDWLARHPALPLPGAGDTLGRWQLLAQIGAQDLCLAKLLEAHYDAAAILHELDARRWLPGNWRRYGPPKDRRRRWP